MQSYQHAIPQAVGNRAVESRARFIMRTYNHLFLSILAFAGLEYLLFTSGVAYQILQVVGGSPLILFGGFVIVSWFATSAAHRAESKAAQYAALGAFIAAEAIIFVPLLAIAQAVAPGAIQSAGLVTIVGFAGLTAVAWSTKKDFSFLGSILRWGGIMALVAIGAALIFGFHLGTWFSVAMVAFAGGAILYSTSDVLRHYPEDRYVAGALQLFASVAMMFYYVLRIFISSRD